MKASNKENCWRERHALSSPALVFPVSDLKPTGSGGVSQPPGSHRRRRVREGCGRQGGAFGLSLMVPIIIAVAFLLNSHCSRSTYKLAKDCLMCFIFNSFNPHFGLSSKWHFPGLEGRRLRLKRLCPLLGSHARIPPQTRVMTHSWNSRRWCFSQNAEQFLLISKLQFLRMPWVSDRLCSGSFYYYFQRPSP